MKFTYDKEADAAYVAFEEVRPKGVKHTIALNEDVIVDFDNNNKIIGIEILSASKNLNKKGLKQVVEA
ncbi:MAG: DUF2283 domain-containing protein [Candidatus Diapherotrites archaeon]